jgi:hypothetical protein
VRVCVDFLAQALAGLNADSVAGAA